MAFDLKRVLKVMLFASNGYLSVKDIQTAISRFHDQAADLALSEDVEGESVATAVETTSAGTSEAATVSPVTGDVPAGETAEVPALAMPVESNEFYTDVPTLVTTAQIREAMDAITDEMRLADSDVVVLESSAGWRLATHPRFARWVRLLRNEPPPVRLSASALETLAVIAYRQPVTRAEIELIRGVSAEAGVTKLLERDLVYIVGRADQPGRPLQFGTTDTFLEFIGIKSLDELPASDVLSPRQIDAWLQTSATPHPSSDAEMGLDETEADQLTLAQAHVGEEETEVPVAEEISAGPSSESAPTTESAAPPDGERPAT